MLTLAHAQVILSITIINTKVRANIFNWTQFFKRSFAPSTETAWRSGSEGHRLKTRCHQGLFHSGISVKIYPYSCDSNAQYQAKCEMYWLTEHLLYMWEVWHELNKYRIHLCGGNLYKQLKTALQWKLLTHHDEKSVGDFDFVEVDAKNVFGHKNHSKSFFPRDFYSNEEGFKQLYFFMLFFGLSRNSIFFGSSSGWPDLRLTRFHLFRIQA